jgi:hypothetical protein
VDNIHLKLAVRILGEFLRKGLGHSYQALHSCASDTNFRAVTTASGLEMVGAASQFEAGGVLVAKLDNVAALTG